jgi:hypothetical protein
MNRMVYILQAVGLIVFIYVVTFFLITWRWPESLLSIFVIVFFLHLIYLIFRRKRPITLTKMR